MEKFILSLAVLVLSISTVSAQSIDEVVANHLSAATGKLIKGHRVKSSFNNKNYELCVSLPKTYSEQDSLRYPVLYILDGKYSFNLMNSIKDMLEYGREIKDFIMVSIDAESNSSADWLASRNYDYTPSSDLQSDTLWSKLLGIPEGKLKSGGAEKFLSTLEKELIPFINTQYKTTSDCGLSGHSLGGLFAGYCLIKKPNLFKRYGINSPSFWWNKSEMIQEVINFTSKNSELSAKVLFSVGGAEDPMMLSSFNAFTSAIKSRNYKGLSMNVKKFDEETHLSVVPVCSSRTLKELYGVNVK